MEISDGDVMWSDLLEELVDTIANHVSSEIELVRIRSICKSWRCAVETKKRFQNRFLPYLLPDQPDHYKKARLLYPTTFLRVTHPYSTKGWLIKTRQVSKSSKITLMFPLSVKLVRHCDKTLDLLKFGVSEIVQSYEIHLLSIFSLFEIQIGRELSEEEIMSLELERYKQISYVTSRVVLVDDVVVVVDWQNILWCCKGGKGPWRRLEDEESEYFVDVIVHQGQVYVLGLKGEIWWVKLSELNIYQHTSSTPLLSDYDELDYNKDKRLVEYCGDLCIIHCLTRKTWDSNVKENLKFKLYKIDKEWMIWVEVSCLGDKAIVFGPDHCFTVLASEYYGCLENAIYFTEFNGDIKVFKLGDGSIMNNTVGSSSQDCFQMFSPPPFL